MDESDTDPHSHSAGGRIPTGPLAATLHSQVADVMRVLHAGRDDAAGNPTGARSRILEKHAPPLAAGMIALGQTLADFFAASAEPVDYTALRAQFLEPILDVARSLPVFQRAAGWVARREEGAELQRMLLEGRPMGFDAQTLLLDAFFQDTPGTRALRVRAEALMRAYHRETGANAGNAAGALRVLVLGASSVLNLTAPLQPHGDEARHMVAIVDPDTQALRHAGQRIAQTFKTRPLLVRSAPEAVAGYSARLKPPFDVIYTLALYDRLGPEAARELTRRMADLLKPGGALLTGSYLPALSPPHRALAKAFVGLDWHYRDAAAWRDLLAPLPFDLPASHLVELPPATLTVLARRR